MPSGTEKRTPSPTCSSVPTIACSAPPLVSGSSGPVIRMVSRKKFGWIAAAPRATVYEMTRPSATRTSTAAPGHERRDELVDDGQPVVLTEPDHAREDREEDDVPADPEADHAAPRQHALVDDPDERERAHHRPGHGGDPIGGEPPRSEPSLCADVFRLVGAHPGRLVRAPRTPRGGSSHQISVAAPERDRFTITDAMLFTTSVSRNSTRPAARRAERPLASESP